MKIKNCLNLILKVLIAFGLWIPFVVRAEQACFPISRAVHDKECYSMDSKKECLETKDIYSCGWGERKEDPPSDDDLLICADSRCPNHEGDEPLEEDEE